jgi:hypothetical protein
VTIKRSIIHFINAISGEASLLCNIKKQTGSTQLLAALVSLNRAGTAIITFVMKCLVFYARISLLAVCMEYECIQDVWDSTPNMVNMVKIDHFKLYNYF